MSGELVGYFSKRFIVETGKNCLSFNNREVMYTEWEFDRAFDDQADAKVYAFRIAEDHEHVRVVDRGELDA